MKKRSAQECINGIVQNIEKRRNMQPIDYSDRNAVRRYNAAMDRIIENVDYLSEHYPEDIDLLVNLANSPDCAIAVCCAHLLYNAKNSTNEHRHIALSVLKRLVNHPDVPELTRYGISINIKQWETDLAAR